MLSKNNLLLLTVSWSNTHKMKIVPLETTAVIIQMLIANVALPLMTAPRWSSVKHVVLGHTYTALDSRLVVQNRPPLNATPATPLHRSSQRSRPNVQPTQRPTSQPRSPTPPPPPHHHPCCYHIYHHSYCHTCTSQ